MRTHVPKYVPTLYFYGNSHMNYSYSSGNVEYGFQFMSNIVTSLSSAGKRFTVQNYSIGGQTTQQLIDAFAIKMQNLRKGDTVLFCEIANDLGVVNSSQALLNIQSLLNRVRAKGANFLVCSTLPSTGPNESSKLTCDAAIRSSVSSYGDAFIDFRSVTGYQTVADTLGAGWNTSDRTHLSTLGYSDLSSYSYSTIASYIP